MGNFNSKVENDKKIVQSDSNITSSPISTPKPKFAVCDPRSPSESIARTPIQVCALFNKSDTPIIGEIHNDSTVIIDPRSPTVEFTRTPIITVSNPSAVKLRNKNLDVVRQQLTDFSPNRKTPKLIAVSPFTAKKPDETPKRNSYLGLLETNLDYVETNLDEVTPKREDKEKLEKMSMITETLERIIQIDKEIKEVIAITQNPIEQFEDPTKDFDRKVTNLIYEDQKPEDVLTKPMTITEEPRLALTERNVNQHNKQLSINKLKVSDKPNNKKDFAVSKIPVFKEKKSCKSKITTQCENTPPRQKQDTDFKTNKSQWDADNTLII